MELGIIFRKRILLLPLLYSPVSNEKYPYFLSGGKTHGVLRYLWFYMLLSNHFFDNMKIFVFCLQQCSLLYSILYIFDDIILMTCTTVTNSVKEIFQSQIYKIYFVFSTIYLHISKLPY